MKPGKKLEKIKQRTKFYNNFKELKISPKDLVDKILEKCAEENHLIETFPYNSTLMNELQTQIYFDIKDNQRSLSYIESNYDFKRNDIELDLNALRDIYLDLIRDKEVLQKINLYLENVDKVKNKNELLKEFINDLEYTLGIQYSSNFNQDFGFFEPNGQEFKRAYEYVNDITYPLGISYYDKGERRFNYPQSLGMFLMPTGSGKTMLLLVTLIANLVQNNKVLYLHGEMSRAEMNERIIPFMTEGAITKYDIKSGNYDKYKPIRNNLVKKYGHLLDLVGPETIKGPLTLPLISELIRYKRPKIVLIDYLQLIQGVEDYMNPITKKLKLMCDVYNTVIIIAAQSKTYTKYTNEFPTLDDIEKCKSTANCCDWVISAKTQYIEELRGILYQFFVLKTRQGGIPGKCPYKYVLDPNNGKFNKLKT